MPRQKLGPPSDYQSNYSTNKGLSESWGLFYLEPIEMMHERNLVIYEKIISRVEIIDLGFILNGVPSACWIWQGGTSGNGRGGGYGRMSLYGCTTAVHLVMWKINRGVIPAGRQIDHMCNNRLCCNLDHLQMVTNLKNQRLRAKRQKEKARVYCEAA